MVGLLIVLGLALLAMPVLLVWMLVSLAGVKERLAVLERELAAARSRAGAERPAAAQPGTATAFDDPGPTLAELMRGSPGTASPSPEPAPPVAPAPASAPQPQLQPAAAAPNAGPPPIPVPLAAHAPAPQIRRPLPPAAAPARESAVLRMIKGWFTTGNVPVKIGVLVLLAGVAALLKYASDQGLFVLPMELRLASVAAAALAALVFAWRRREQHRIFALSVQGGAIGVLLLVVFAAFKLYAVIDPVPAFVLSVALVAGAVLLALLQNSPTLAAFALLAGYLAPVWLSTGSGNHVALFSYYAMLNTAVVVIAWFKSWRVLNLLGFVFTFGIGSLWGASAYVPEKYASTQPFLALFFAFYLVVPLLFARRQPAGRRDLVDGCLVFGTPLIAFSLQAALMEGERLPLAFCALGLALLYALLGVVLRRREGYQVLVQSYAVLAVGFATLAVPLGLNARATASVFALEGAGLVWLGLRRQRWLPRFSGIALQLAAAIALLVGMEGAQQDLQPLFNPTAMGMLLIALAGFASAWAAHARGALAAGFYLWGLAWWVGNGIHEIDRFAAPDLRADLLLVFAAATAWLAAEVHRRRPALLLAWTLPVALLACLPLLLWQLDLHQHPFGHLGGLAWAVLALLVLRALACMRAESAAGAGLGQFIAWLLAPLVLSLEAHWMAGQSSLGQGWEVALAALPWLATTALALWRWPWLAAPRDPEITSVLRMPLLWLLFAILAGGWLALLKRPLDPAPLAWLPLLNPGELAQLAVLVLAGVWLGSDLAPRGLEGLRVAIPAAGGFLLLSVITLRGVHFWGGIGWNGSLLSSSLAQTSLTVVWSVLGVLGWIVGSRSGRRGLWLASAVLMGVVLAKLVLVDRSHLGNLTGIVSFIAYGLLCMIVGYLAPAPPREGGSGESRA